MSLERLNQLWDILKTNRYVFLNPDSGEVIEFLDSALNDYHEGIHWQIFKSEKAKKIDLYFPVMNDLGLYSGDINDISECCIWYNETFTGVRLFFSKINSKSWKLDLTEFINNLNDFECKIL